jgi:2-isopropylmalate synthase
VDAIYRGLQELTGTSYTLVSYSIQAITGGTDAQGDVTVVLEDKGRRASARAAHTDVLVASAEAYLAAINRMAALKHVKLNLKGV